MNELKLEWKMELFFIARNWYKYGVYALLCLFVFCNGFLYVQQPLIFNWKHPLFLVFIGINILLMVLVVICILNTFYQKKIVEIFAPVNENIDNVGTDINYREVSELLAPLYPLKQKLDSCNKKYKALHNISRILLQVVYLLTIVLISCTFFIKLNLVNGDLVSILLLKVGIICCVLFFIYMNNQAYPKVDSANRTFFILLIIFYLVIKTLSDATLRGNSLGDFQRIIFSEVFTKVLNFLADTIPYLLLVCLCFIFGNSYFKSNTEEKICKYDLFIAIYLGITEVVFDIENDQQLLDILSAYDVWKSQNKDSLEEFGIDMFNEENFQRFIVLHELLIEYMGELTEELLEEFAVLFGMFPAWLDNVLEEELVDIAHIMLQES